MKINTPVLQYDPSMPSDSFPAWREKMGVEMRRIMKHPNVEVKSPKLIKSLKRDGYTLEKWESYPLPESVVSFLVLIPDGVSANNQAPAALCIPGFGQTKELLAGERMGNYNLEGEPDSVARKAQMALHYVKNGIIAVAVDNPCFGELSDNGYSDYLTSSRFLLEIGWNYLGLTSWQDKLILDWMKHHPAIKNDRIIASGFSLGTEPMMVLGLLDDSIFAFVYNDFLCRTRERALVLNKPDDNGFRKFPNSIEHLIPEFLTTFDFPDIVAALAPRPVICTEGGLDRDFKLIQSAYEKVGAKDNFEYHHYQKFLDPTIRWQGDSLPDGLDSKEFFRIANVDPPSHYFKTEHVMPWLKKILNRE